MDTFMTLSLPPNAETEQYGRPGASAFATGVARARSLPGPGLRPTPPTDPYVSNSLIRFVSDGPCGPKTLRVTTPQGVMTVAAHQNTCMF
jgi:hypothetical protein